MEGDPFVRLAGMVGGSDGTVLRLRLGRVKTTAPLTLEAGGITLSGGELRLCAQLAEQPATITPQLPDATPYQAIIMPRLSAGDELLLLTEDDQLFYILCKVVSA